MTDAQKFIEECAARIEALMGVTPNDDSAGEARVRIHNAQETASNCAQCGRPLKPSEPVWRACLSLGRTILGGEHWRIAPMCKKCRSDFDRFDPPKPCEGCGRPVYNRLDYNWQRWPRRWFCCEVCHRKTALAAAQQRRSKARGTRTCDECGKTFKPTRTDMRFCSIACKQRAYRGRWLGKSRNGGAR